MKPHAANLRKALTESHDYANLLDQPGFPLAALDIFQSWQRQRLSWTYSELISQERYRQAGDFFLSELYGGLNFRQRDQQVERVLPVMERMLPDNMLRVLAESFELQSLSLGFDIDMTRSMQAHGWDKIDTRRYGELYRQNGRVREREKQIDMIRDLGLALNELVNHRLVLLLIRTVRGPARAAGFGLLQTFLENGLTAFQKMGDGSEFVETIWNREKQIMHRLLNADEQPFAWQQVMLSTADC